MQFPKRLQIHLSTALICMIVAGVLIGANATKRDCNLYWITGGTVLIEKVGDEWGWPWTFYADYLLGTHPYQDWHSWVLVSNSLVCIAIVSVIAAAQEWFIHFRKTRNLKPAVNPQSPQP